jgi:hypothetical protein
MAEEERRSKRSRFDQTEPEPRKPSRFDRRSRSPSSRQADTRRSRSPLSKDSRSPTVGDPAAAAGQTKPNSARRERFADMKSLAAAAAKINAELQARRGIQHVDVPPIRSVSINTPSTTRYIPILTPLYRLKVLSQKPPLLPPAKARAS